MGISSCSESDPLHGSTAVELVVDSDGRSSSDVFHLDQKDTDHETVWQDHLVKFVVLEQHPLRVDARHPNDSMGVKGKHADCRHVRQQSEKFDEDNKDSLEDKDKIFQRNGLFGAAEPDEKEDNGEENEEEVEWTDDKQLGGDVGDEDEVEEVGKDLLDCEVFEKDVGERDGPDEEVSGRYDHSSSWKRQLT